MRPVGELSPEAQAELREFEAYLVVKQQRRLAGLPRTTFQEWRRENVRTRRAASTGDSANG